VARVDLEGVEAGLDGQTRSGTELLDGRRDLVLAQRSRERLGVGAEGAGGSHGRRLRGPGVREPPRVAELDRRACALGVDRLREATKPGKSLLAHPDLVAEGTPLGGHRAVGERGHPHAPHREGAMPLDQAIRDQAVARHPLVGAALDDAVAQLEGAEPRR
jgi:hypothetical protein